MELQDKVALVTGSSHGLGKATCLLLASEGAKVAVNYRSSAERAEEVVQEIKAKYNTEAFSIYADVCKESDVVAMFEKIDLNGDGAIDKQERDDHLSKMMGFMKEGKCGEGMKEGAAKMEEGKCGEGKCGEGVKEGAAKMKEGKCGEGKSGEGVEEGAAKMKEGKCGEGKCGGNK